MQNNMQIKSQVNHLPFKLNYNGEAKCKEYFYDQIKEEKGKKEVSFYGRKLIGHEIYLDQQVQGVILDQSIKQEDININHFKKFDSIHTWKHDQNFSKEDRINEQLKLIYVLNEMEQQIDFQLSN